MQAHIGQRTEIDREAGARPIAESQARQAFDPVIKVAHWLTLFLIICLFSTAALAEAGVSDAAKRTLVQLHRSFGLTLWTITILRLVWRQFAEFPDWPADMPRALGIVLNYTEPALYSLLLVQPILGLLYTNARGNAIHFYFLVRIPPLISQDKGVADGLIEAHEFVASLLLIVIASHVSTMLYRHFIRRDNALNRMLPRALSIQARSGGHLENMRPQS
jgi:cytochrome b561